MKRDDDRFVENMALLIAMLMALLIGLGVAGSGDLEEAETQAKVYNDMVCAGHWPDYENRKPKCN